MKTTTLNIILLTVLSLLSCESSRRTKFQHLQDQGILPVSTSNAYLGTNLLLAQEIEQSTFFYNFLNSRGAPLAIEFNKRGHELILYYPKEREVYRADFSEPEWIIRGPFSIKRSDYRILKSILSQKDSGEPIFELWGRTHRFKMNQTPSLENRIRALIPTPKPTPRPKPRPKPKSEPTLAYPTNFDQEALAITREASKTK